MKENSVSPLPGYLTTAEAAARSGLDQETIAHYLRPHTRGKITHPPKLRGIKVASIWLVEAQSLAEYLESDRKRGARSKKK